MNTSNRVCIARGPPKERNAAGPPTRVGYACTEARMNRRPLTLDSVPDELLAEIRPPYKARERRIRWATR